MQIEEYYTLKFGYFKFANTNMIDIFVKQWG